MNSKSPVRSFPEAVLVDLFQQLEDVDRDKIMTQCIVERMSFLLASDTHLIDSQLSYLERSFECDLTNKQEITRLKRAIEALNSAVCVNRQMLLTSLLHKFKGVK